MYLILAESELELVPKSVANDAQVLAYCKHADKKPEKTILDSSLFYKAVESLPDGKRRGRPDLVHMALVLALDSPAAKRGKLQVFIHTRNNEVIRVRDDTRVPKNFNRFVGLIEQLFEKGRVPPEGGEPLMTLEKKTLAQLLRELSPKETILFDVKGELADHAKLKSIPHSAAVIIGGFPHGDFSPETKKLATKTYKVADSELLAATAVAYIVTAIE